MTSKVKVYGRAQNRTVLGIAHAYLVMYSHATIEDLRKAFPNSLCPDKGVNENFLPLEEALGFNGKMSLYFAKDDEVLTLQDGSKIALAQVWSKQSFDRMVEQASLYGIEVAEFEKTSGPGQKGGFRLEYLNGYVPPVPDAGKKGMSPWIWLLLLLLVAGAAAWWFLGRDTEPAEPQVIEKIVEKEVVVRDTVYVQQIEVIETAFNAAKFEQGKSDLNDDAKLALHDLAKVLRQNPGLKLSIEGHTSAEGDSLTNLKLSEKRAQSAVDFLVSREGVDASRLTAVGRGSSMPKDAANPEANRRTEFVLIEK